MNTIETIICLILLLMAVPDLCRKLGRPALANVLFVVFGLSLAGLLDADEITLIKQAGQVGFLLVLFEVGLEISLPSFRAFLPSLRYALLWALIQYPLLLMLAQVAGFSWAEGFMVAAAMTGCSMSMAYSGWKNFPGLKGAPRDFALQIMVALEVLAIVAMSINATTVSGGFGWSILWKLGVMGVVIFGISRLAAHVVKLFQWIIEKTTHWRVHFLVLLVLLICAVCDRLGLAAPKAAFFLGMFMARTQFHGHSLEEHIAPISRRFLIPIFFVSLGMMVDARILLSYGAVLALCGAFLLLGFREVVHRRWLQTGGPGKTFLLFCPNLTMAALAATSLLLAGKEAAATWVTLFGLFFTVLALWLLPPVRENQGGEGH
jgi:Kef-type K+ transport system membrane component KefB